MLINLWMLLAITGCAAALGYLIGLEKNAHLEEEIYGDIEGTLLEIRDNRDRLVLDTMKSAYQLGYKDGTNGHVYAPRAGNS